MLTTWTIYKGLGVNNINTELVLFTRQYKVKYLGVYLDSKWFSNKTYRTSIEKS